MVAVKDAIPESVIPNWHYYSFIPLWFFFIFGFGVLFFVSLMYVNGRDFEILIVCGIILLVILGGLISAILSFLNVTVLPIVYNSLTMSYQYTISWFIVLIPAYIFALVMFIGMMIGVGITLIDDWQNTQPLKKRCKHFGVAMFLSVLNMCLIVAIIMIGFTLEYPIFFPPYYPAIPSIIVAIGFIIITAKFLWKERNNQYSNDKFIMLFGLIFFTTLSINIVLIAMYPWLLSYSWFSSLLPLTAAYAFVCRLLYDG